MEMLMEVSGERHEESLQISVDILINSRAYSNTFWVIVLIWSFKQNCRLIWTLSYFLHVNSKTQRHWSLCNNVGQLTYYLNIDLTKKLSGCLSGIASQNMLNSQIWDTPPACPSIRTKLLIWIFCKHDRFGKLFHNLINLPRYFPWLLKRFHYLSLVPLPLNIPQTVYVHFVVQKFKSWPQFHRYVCDQCIGAGIF